LAFAEKAVPGDPHWMRHTHATHALQGGAELTSVRDNLRDASIATTSIYVHSDDVKPARQMAAVNAVSPPKPMEILGFHGSPEISKV
jgi:site-specific recombinase XerD